MNRIVAKTDNNVQAQINVLCQFVTEGLPKFRPKDFDDTKPTALAFSMKSAVARFEYLTVAITTATLRFP